MDGPLTTVLALSLAAAPPLPTVVPSAGPASAPPSQPDRQRARRPGWGCEESPKECRAISIAGIVLTTLGVAAIGTGAGLLAKPNQSIPGEPAFERAYRPAGGVAITAGAVVTLGGILMLVSGRLRARRARR